MSTDGQPKPSPGEESHDLTVRVEALAVEAKIAGGKDAGVGVVESAGAAARRFRPGDEVCYAEEDSRPGPQEEFRLVDERLASRKPGQLAAVAASIWKRSPAERKNALLRGLGLAPSGRGETFQRTQSGYVLAVLSSILLIGDVALLAATFATVFLATGFRGVELETLLMTSPLPLGIYALWALGLLGTVLAFVSIAVYGFRARWFWRCLVATACGWLAFPPLPTVLGLLALVLLFRFHHAFPKGVAPETDAP